MKFKGMRRSYILQNYSMDQVLDYALSLEKTMESKDDQHELDIKLLSDLKQKLSDMQDEQA